MSFERRKLGTRALLAATVVAAVAAAVLRSDPVRLRASNDPHSAAPSAAVLQAPQNPGCRIAAGPLIAMGGKLEGSIRNLGTTSVTLSSLEFGWAGGKHLVRVAASLDGGVERFLWDEPVLSPAFLPLEEGLTLAPGAGATLSLTFDGGAPALSSAAPLLVSFQGGCLLALVAGAAVPCEVSVTPPEFPVTAPFAAEFSINNATNGPLSLAAFRMTWPEAANGTLLSLRIDGLDVGAFLPGQVSSPARLDLNKLIGQPVVVPAGGSVRFRAQFERAVENNPDVYRVAVDDVDGCQAASAPGNLAEDCGIRILDLAVGNGKARLQVANLEPVTRTVQGVDLYWPAEAAGPLREVRADGGRVLWSGEASSPAQLLFATGPVVRPSGRLELVFVFGTTTVQDDARSLSNGAYSAVAHFGGECRAVYSTRTDEAAECSLAAGELTVQGNTAVVSVSNSGPEVRLNRVGLSWPLANGALTTADLGQVRLWEGTAPARSVTFTVPAGVPSEVGRGQRRQVALGFQNPAVASPYALTLSFAQVSGASCPEILVSVRPPAGTCLLKIDPPTALTESQLSVPIDNGGDTVALQLLELAWAGDARLLEGYLTNPDGSRQPLWQGDPGAVSPTRLVPNVPAVLEVGLSQLVLLFSASVSPQAISVYAVADRCQASWAPPGGTKLPEVTQLNGWIRALPGAGLTGWWDISVLVENEAITRRVWVDGGTLFEPANIDPEAGDLVSVDLARDAEDRERALRIRFQRPPFTEIRGVVESITGGERPETMVVNGQTIFIADALVDGRLIVGAVVTVQGSVTADGAIVAMRVAVIDTHVGEFVEFRGIVQSAAADPDVDGFQVWNVDGRRVRVDAALAGLPDPEVLPALGTHVWVKGRMGDTMIGVVATGDGAELLAAPSLMVIDAVVIQTPMDGIVGPWLVADDGGGSRRVKVPSTAIVDERIGRAVVGARVRIVADDTPDGLVALRIRVESNP